MQIVQKRKEDTHEHNNKNNKSSLDLSLYIGYSETIWHTENV